MNQPLLILASSSPRRSQLLQLAGWDFQVHPANIDESVLPGERPEDYVLRLAEGKARATATALSLEDGGAGPVILASDTAVVDPLPDGRAEILGKPVDPADARRMLAQLGGRTHQVLTALVAYRPADGLLEQILSVTDVTMRAYSTAEIEAYVAGGDPMDKAGAYAIQHTGFHPVERLDGCYSGVMGLPVCRLPRLLRPFALPIPPAQARLSAVCGDGRPASGTCQFERWADHPLNAAA